MNFTLIAYRESHNDYRRDEHSASDLEIYYDTDLGVLVERIVEEEFKKARDDQNMVEHTLLVNGVNIEDLGYDHGSNEEDEKMGTACRAMYVDLLNEARARKKEAIQKAAEDAAKAKRVAEEAATAAKLAAEALAESKQREKDLEQFAALKAKYGL